MIRKSISSFIICLILAVGCTALPPLKTLKTLDLTPLATEIDQNTSATTPTHSIPTLEALGTDLPVIQTITPANTVLPFPIMNFDQGYGIEISADQITPDCTGSREVNGTNLALADGLVAYSRTDKVVKIWENGEFINVKNTKDILSSGITRGGSWVISPDGQWLFYDYWKDQAPVIGVLQIKTGNQIEQDLGNIDLGKGGIVWGDENHVLIPLENEVDLFKWLVWNPFRQELDTISVHLPGIGGIVDPIDPTHVFILPVYDYPANLVIYACRDCGENEYQAVNVKTGQLQWGVDLGSSPLNIAQYSPILSPTGENLVIYFGENKFWILNDTGESVLRVILPQSPLQGGVAQAITWSLDGKHLAFIRDSSDPDAPHVSVVSLEQRQLFDLCNTDLYYGGLYWSYDNQYLLHERYRGDEKETVYTVLGIHSDISFRFITQDDLLILGWRNP